MHWCTPVGVLTRPSINKVTKRNLLELAMGAGGRESVGARQMEY